MFENPEIEIESLPGTDALQWQQLDPQYKKLRQVQSMLALLIIAVPLLFVTVVAEIPALPATIVWSQWLIVLIVSLHLAGHRIPKARLCGSRQGHTVSQRYCLALGDRCAVQPHSAR